MFDGENICGEKWGFQGNWAELWHLTLCVLCDVKCALWGRDWRCWQAIPLLKADLNDTGDVAVSAMLTTIEEVCNLCELCGHIGHSCIVRPAMLVPISLILCTSGYTNITKDCELARTASRASRNHRQVPVYTCCSIRFEQLQNESQSLPNCFHLSVVVYFKINVASITSAKLEYSYILVWSESNLLMYTRRISCSCNPMCVAVIGDIQPSIVLCQMLPNRVLINASQSRFLFNFVVTIHELD